MNVLFTVLGFLIIFACTFGLSLRKVLLTQDIDRSYISHTEASRKILNQYEDRCYDRLRYVKKKKQIPSHPKKKTVTHEIKNKPNLNLPCARFNLSLLVTDGKEKHRELYEAAAKLIRSLYANLISSEPRFEYKLLDAILDSARFVSLSSASTPILLEKLSLRSADVKQLYILQGLYYRMLRGTKKTGTPTSYPSFIDYFKIENGTSRICLHHASDEMLRSLFGPRVAPVLREEIKKTKSAISVKRVQNICGQNGLIAPSDEFLELFDYKTSKNHSISQEILVQEIDGVCLKQKIFLNS